MVRRGFKRVTELIRRPDQERPGGMRSAVRLVGELGIEPATVADVGASDGSWSRIALDTFPNAQLVLFEPQPVHAPALERFQSEHPRSMILRSAVGGTGGRSLFDATDPWGGVLQKAPTTGSISVPVVTLDEALATLNAPLLVKLDTHGVEAEILAGGQETLTRSVAWIIEAYNYRITPECLLFWDLCECMSTHGFRPIDLVDVLHRPIDDTLWQFDLVFIRSDWAGFDDLGYR